MYSKKFFKALLLPLCILIFSCSSDDSTSNQENTSAGNQTPSGQTAGTGVAGKWKAVSYIYDGELFTITDVCQQEVLEINANGLAVSTKYCPNGDFVTQYTWTHNGTDIYGFDSEDTYFPVTYHLTFPEGNNNMYSTYTEPQPHSFTKIYVRI